VSPRLSGFKSRHGRIATHPAALLAVVVLWIVGAASGLGLLASYSTAASPSAAAPSFWPTQSRIVRAQELPTLLLFLHPHCPCSSATLAELNRIRARASEGVFITVAFFAPSLEDVSWGDSRLRDNAEAMRNDHLTVVNDADGIEASLFGARSSGHAVLYDANGRLRFRGGITAARGHEGDNLGAASIVSILTGRTPPAAHAPTFGCAITQVDIPDECCTEEAQ
jgi:hypothetical protein